MSMEPDLATWPDFRDALAGKPSTMFATSIIAAFNVGALSQKRTLISAFPTLLDALAIYASENSKIDISIAKEDAEDAPEVSA